jgi:hypothetical protein
MGILVLVVERNKERIALANIVRTIAAAFRLDCTMMKISREMYIVELFH